MRPKTPGPRGTFLHKRNGALDLSWLLLVVDCAATVGVILLDGFHVGGFGPVSNAAYACLGGFGTMCFIAGAARDRAEILANATSPGAVASAIASSLIREHGGNAEDADPAAAIAAGTS